MFAAIQIASEITKFVQLEMSKAWADLATTFTKIQQHQTLFNGPYSS